MLGGRSVKKKYKISAMPDPEVIQKKLIVIQKDTQVYLENHTGYQLENLNPLRAFLNCILCEKFNLSINPAHEGGVTGENVEFVNMQPVGLKHDLVSPLSNEGKRILAFYKELLTNAVAVGHLGKPYPYLYFTEKDRKYFSNKGWVLNYLVWGVLLGVEIKEQGVNEKPQFMHTVMQRISREMDSLFAPHVVGVMNYLGVTH